VVLSQPLGWLFPNLVYFYPLDALAADKPIPLKILALAARYCACFIAGVLALGAALFQRRSLDAQGTSASMPGLVSLLAWAGRISAILLCLVGLEGVLAFGATQTAPSFRALFLKGLKAMFFSPQSADAWVLIPAVGMIAAGVLTWMLSGFFGRGARWSHRVVLVLVVVNLLHLLVFATGLAATTRYRPSDEPVLLATGAILTAAVLVILLLPKTRRHFQAVSRRVEGRRFRGDAQDV